MYTSIFGHFSVQLKWTTKSIVYNSLHHEDFPSQLPFRGFLICACDAVATAPALYLWLCFPFFNALWSTTVPSRYLPSDNTSEGHLTSPHHVGTLPSHINTRCGYSSTVYFERESEGKRPRPYTYSFYYGLL